MSKSLGVWKTTIQEMYICQPKKNIKVTATHSLIDCTNVAKFDCNKTYEYVYDEDNEKYWVENEGHKYCFPFSKKEFNEFFIEVAEVVENE